MYLVLVVVSRMIRTGQNNAGTNATDATLATAAVSYGERMIKS